MKWYWLGVCFSKGSKLVFGFSKAFRLVCMSTGLVFGLKPKLN